MHTKYSKDDIKRWHLELHPDVVRELATNSFPHPIKHAFHPTHANLTHTHGSEVRTQEWTSRHHRKHRHIQVSPRTNKKRHETTLLRKMARLRKIEYWNISWWVATSFTLGSIIWVVNGFTSWLPLVNSHFGVSLVSTGVTTFIGATIFEIGSIFGMWEAWNRDDRASFGWAVHHNHDEERVEVKREEVEVAVVQRGGNKRWIWFTLDRRYWRELGFLAAFCQFWGATIFWISGFTALPSIQEGLLSRNGVRDGVFWTPQVVGGSGFIISSTFIMLECQHKWYKPKLRDLGWNIGFWNFIGGVGFTLCGALGYGSAFKSGVLYQSSLCTFWASWAFLIGSVLQWYEISVSTGSSYCFPS